MAKEEKKYLSADEFFRLSDTEKADYYAMLASERTELRKTVDKLAIAEAYRAMGKYQETESILSELEEEIAYLKKKAQAASERMRKKIFRWGGVVLGIIAVIVGIVLVVTLTDTKGKKYEEAIALYESERYSEALAIFETLPDDYEKVKLYVTMIKGKFGEGKINGKAVRTGDIITLGSWYADGDPENSKSEIEWIVLDVDMQKNRALMISVDILAARAFGDTDVWKNSDICKWLNGEFYNEAFSAEERQKIASVLYEERDDEDYVISAWNSKLSLLSSAEKMKYLATVTNSVATGAGVKEWWLRTSAGEELSMYVSSKGQMMTEGKASDTEEMGVRPIAWINFD